MRGRIVRHASAVLAVGVLLASPVRAAAGSDQGAQPQWTEDRLLSQLVMVAGNITAPTTVSTVVADGVGGIVFLGQPAASARGRIVAGLAGLQATASVPLLMATDEEGGGVQRLANVAGSLPWPRQMSAWWGPATLQARVTSVATQMAALGITMDLGPVADTAPAGDQIDWENLRSFSDQAALASRDVRAFLRGLAAAKVLGVVKHFPGLGHANGDTDTGVASDLSLANLQTPDLVPFRDAIAAGVPAVMMSNVLVPDWGALPSSLSPAAYAYLRSLGFTGLVLTDSLGAGAITAGGRTQASAAVAAVEAGADMVMVNNASQYRPTLVALRAAVATGALTLGNVVAKVNRILTAKNRSRAIPIPLVKLP